MAGRKNPPLRGCVRRLASAAVALTLASSLAVPVPALAADAGTVELGIDVKNAAAVAPAPGEDASVELGIDLGLVQAQDDGEAPAGYTGTVPLGLDVAYDRTVETSYVIRLDPNNGDRADAFRGSVFPARLSVPKDPDYDRACDEGTLGSYEGDVPPGVSADALAAVTATRPGYEFAGWYWAKTEDGRVVTDDDDYGRAVLAGSVVNLSALGNYDYVRAHAGETLYAKWVLADKDVVRLHLQDAKNDGVADVDLWFWQGRGYTYERPEADCEADPAFTVVASAEDAPATLDLAIGQNPDPPASTQYFAGWGFEDNGSGALSQRYLVTCAKKEDDAGVRRAEYAFGDWAFNQDYVEVRSGNPVWVGTAQGDDAADAPAGQLLATLAPLFKTAKINVSAPFQVTFTKDRTTTGDHVPYTADDLSWTGGKTEAWVMSAEQPFTNKGDTSVYVSRIECADSGASSLFANAAKGISLFSLGTSASGPGSGKSVLFGVSGGSRDVSVDPELPDTWIVLKNKAGDNTTKLYFGLNIREAGFDKDGIVQSSEEGSSYAAGLANVKYTYSVAD